MICEFLMVFLSLNAGVNVPSKRKKLTFSGDLMSSDEKSKIRIRIKMSQIHNNGFCIVGLNKFIAEFILLVSSFLVILAFSIMYV